jgi:hypothetical protein
VYESKQAALGHLLTQGVNKAIVHWLAVNLISDGADPEQYRYCFDIEFIYKLFQDFSASDVWPFLHEFTHAHARHQPYARHQAQGHHGQSHGSQERLKHAHDSQHGHESKIVFVRAGRNKAWTPFVLEQFAALEQSSESHCVKLVTMEHVGHWLHVDDMQGVVNILTQHTTQQLDHLQQLQKYLTA